MCTSTGEHPVGAGFYITALPWCTLGHRYHLATVSATYGPITVGANNMVSRMIKGSFMVRSVSVVSRGPDL